MRALVFILFTVLLTFPADCPHRWIVTLFFEKKVPSDTRGFQHIAKFVKISKKFSLVITFVLSSSAITIVVGLLQRETLLVRPKRSEYALFSNICGDALKCKEPSRKIELSEALAEFSIFRRKATMYFMHRSIVREKRMRAFI